MCIVSIFILSKFVNLNIMVNKIQLHLLFNRSLIVQIKISP